MALLPSCKGGPSHAERHSTRVVSRAPVHSAWVDGALSAEVVMPHADGQSCLDSTALWLRLLFAAWQDTHSSYPRI